MNQNNRTRCVVRVNSKSGTFYLKSLFPVEWTQFISDGEWYNSIGEAREKLNSRHYRLAQNLLEMKSSESDIDILQYKNGQFDKAVKYIEG